MGFQVLLDRGGGDLVDASADLLNGPHLVKQELISRKGQGSAASRFALHHERGEDADSGAGQLLFGDAFYQTPQLADGDVERLLAALRRRAGIGDDRAVAPDGA